MSEIAFARRSGGTRARATDHTDDPNANDVDSDGDDKVTVDFLRPSRYFGSVGQSADAASDEFSYVVLPEPWQQKDINNNPELTEDDLLNRTPWANNGITDFDGLGIVPNFLLDYENLPAVIPDALQSNHVRPSVATRWDKNGDLVEDSADTLRLWRDPKTQAVEGLIYEPKRTQILSSPQDITSADWNTIGTSSRNSNVGTAKGQNYDEIVESSNNETQEVYQDYTAPSADEPVSHSFIVKANGRNYCYIKSYDGSNTYYAWFDLSTGSALSTGDGNGGSFPGTLIEHDLDDLGNDWYRVELSHLPVGGEAIERTYIGLANGDGVNFYQGDGSSGIYVMHAQAEVSREVTSPILTGGAVREADEVDYRFSFPDKTTGVSFSIKQKSGGVYPAEGNAKFGPTPFKKGQDHGVLMYGKGLNDDNTDGWKTVTRNSDDKDSDGDSPRNETIDRFSIQDLSGINYLNHPFIVRQISVHTAPHTSQQLSDLDSNYLTTP